MSTLNYNVVQDALIVDSYIEHGVSASMSYKMLMTTSSNVMTLSLSNYLIEDGNLTNTMILSPSGILTTRYLIEISTTSSIPPVPPVVIDENIYDLSGSVWNIGAYDSFLGYEPGSVPINKGYGFNGPWNISTRNTRRLITSDVLFEDGTGSYTLGVNISGSNTGKGWADVWNVIEGT